jgi:serine/threonine-protein kinase RsbT
VDREQRIVVASDRDIVTARQEGRRLASTLGFSSSDLTVIAVAISEVARNILSYARTGEITVRLVEKSTRRGIMVVAEDQGPGIEDIGLALEDGFSTSGSLGLGLPGVRRLMDEFEIRSEVGRGTTVILRKWAR